MGKFKMCIRDSLHIVSPKFLNNMERDLELRVSELEKMLFLSKSVLSLSLIHIFLRIMYLDAAKKQEIFGKYGKSNRCV